MANNPYKNKIIYNGQTLLDLTGDTVAPSNLLQGYTAHDASGTPIVGTATGGGVIIEDTIDSHGGTIRTITSANAVTLGSKSITQNGTYTAASDNLNGYSSVTVDVPSGQPTLQSKSVNPTESSQTVTPDSGYDGLSSVSVGAISSTYVGSGVATKAADTITPTESEQTAVAANTYTTGVVKVGAISSTYVGSGITRRSSTDLTASGATVTAPAGYYSSAATKTVSSGSATAPATISATAATVSTGTNTLTLSKSVSVTPTVSAGYVSSGTAGNSNVSLTASVTTQAAQTIYPSSSDQSIASGRYLTGAQTIKGVTTTNLTADNIKSGVTVQVGDSADSDRVLSVTGTYSGGGSSDVAMGTLTVASNVNTSTSTTIATVSTIGFTPTKFFFYKTERTATTNHVHQASFITLGSNYIRTMTRYSNNTLSTSGNAGSWTTQTAGYLYYSSSTVYFRSSSSYILSAGTWNWVAVK